MYMSLHPCRCGETRTSTSTHSSLDAEQGLASEHTGTCVGCGCKRRFVFRLPSWVPQHSDRYGGPDPSQIIDAGEWRLVSLAYMGQLDSVKDRPEKLRQVLEVALAAYLEMLKFIPPGRQEMPESAFFTPRGRQVRATEPPQFLTRSFLEAMVAGVRRDLAAIR